MGDGSESPVLPGPVVRVIHINEDVLSFGVRGAYRGRSRSLVRGSEAPPLLALSRLSCGLAPCYNSVSTTERKAPSGELGSPSGEGFRDERERGCRSPVGRTMKGAGPSASGQEPEDRDCRRVPTPREG